MIRKALAADVSAVSELALLLWPDNDLADLSDQFTDLIEDANCAIFLAYSNELPVGFAQCQLRRDYVEGTDSSPVGYLEGIFVQPEHRGQHWARQLLSACEAWALSKGCSEFASDCELDNDVSYQFHLKMGFIEANRVICFTKQLTM